MARDSGAKDVELLVLRHQVAVPRRLLPGVLVGQIDRVLQGLGVIAVVEAAADGGLGAGQVIRRLWCFLEVDPPTADDTPDPRSES